MWLRMTRWTVGLTQLRLPLGLHRPSIVWPGGSAGCKRQRGLIVPHASWGLRQSLLGILLQNQHVTSQDL